MSFSRFILLVLIFSMPLPVSAESRDEAFVKIWKEIQTLDQKNRVKGLSKMARRKADWALANTWSLEEVASIGRNHRFVFNESRSDVILERWGYLDGGTGGDPFSKNYDEGKPVKVKVKVSLANAARHWLARDRAGTLKWIGRHSELVPEILKGGSWLDPDEVESKDLRVLMRTCLESNDREDLIRQLIAKNSIGRLVDGENPAELRTQIKELGLGEDISENLFKHSLEHEGDPFGD